MEVRRERDEAGEGSSCASSSSSSGHEEDALADSGLEGGGDVEKAARLEKGRCCLEESEDGCDCCG